MPLYEYYCQKCETKFEQLRPMSAASEAATCPTGHDGAMRLISMFSAVGRSEGGEMMNLNGFGSGGGCGCGGACSCGGHAF